jgi:hypothetical protein
MTALSERWHASRRWTIEHVPLPFLTNAHELALGAALILLGAALLLQEAQPGSVVSQVPQWMVTGWSLFLLAGGVLTWVGVFFGRSRREWSGQLLTGYGCAFYALAVGVAIPFKDGAAVVLIFALLSIVSFWRAFKITMTPYVQARLARETTIATLQAKHRGVGTQ